MTSPERARTPASPARVRRRWLTVALIYGVVTLVVFAFAAPATLGGPTPFNHFALLAEGWLHGRLDLGGPPPHHEDFASFAGKYYVVFPPVPALLMVPVVAVAGSAQAVRDGVFFLALAGVGPAVLFLALEKLREHGQSARSERENVALSLLFAFGTVYFFSAVQGTVWFGAHVVGVALAALYLLFAIGAERPLAAGFVLGLGFATRTPLAFAAPLFILEAIRASARSDGVVTSARSDAVVTSARSDGVGVSVRSDALGTLAKLSAVDTRALGRRLAWFALPIVGIGAAMLIYNAVRFGEPFEFGYRFLTIAWRERIEKWGLFSYHYLGRNLAVLLASLPWFPVDGRAPFVVNYHGLALWVTTPLYLLLPWPRRRAPVQVALTVAALTTALPSLLYQNTGWLQFGQRFSNDYAIFLFALLAVGGWSLRRAALALAVIGVAVNAFGAATFGRPEHRHFYFFDRTQTILFEPD